MSKVLPVVVLSGIVVLGFAGLAALNPDHQVISPAFAVGLGSSTPPPPPPPTTTPPTTPPPVGQPPSDEYGGNFAKYLKEHPTTRIGCTPDPKTPDIYFRNIGTTVIPAGTKIFWTAPLTHEHGTFTVPSDVKPGGYVPDTGVLAKALGREGVCLSKLE